MKEEFKDTIPIQSGERFSLLLTNVSKTLITCRLTVRSFIYNEIYEKYEEVLTVRQIDVSPSLQSNVFIPLGLGFLVYAGVTVIASTHAQRGSLYAVGEIVRGGSDSDTVEGSGTRHTQLFAGYIQRGTTQSYPHTQQESTSEEGALVLNSLTNHASLSTYTVPTNEMAKIISLYLRLTTSAVVGNRQVQILTTQNTLNFSATLQAASLIWDYYFDSTQGISKSTTVGGVAGAANRLIEPLSALTLRPADVLSVSLAGAQAGDLMSGIVLTTEKRVSFSSTL